MRKIIGLAVLMITCSALRAAEGDKVCGELEGQILATGSGRVVLLDKVGSELWSFKGANVSDVWLLPNGNVLLADNEAKEVDPKTDQIVWSYKPEFGQGGGTFSAQRLANGMTVIGENSTGRILEVDQGGKIVFEMQLPDITRGSHNNFRCCRKLENGNYLVAFKEKKAVREYTSQGEMVLELKLPNVAFSAVRLPNGNTVAGHIDGITEFDKDGKAVWNFSVNEMPEEVKTGMICGTHCLPNGNIVCGIYSVPLKEPRGAALLEITRDKKIVWRYLGSDKNMMGVQKLTADGKPLAGDALR